MNDTNTAKINSTQSIKSTADVTWTTKTHIAIEPTFLFHYLADFTSTRNWDPHVTDASLNTPGPITQNSSITLDFRVGPHVTKLNYTVHTYEPPHKVVLKSGSEKYDLYDTIEIKPDPNNSAKSIVHYSVELFYKNPNFMNVSLGKRAVRYFANKALRNLKRLALVDSGRIKPMPGFIDKTLLGVYHFTRFGFFGMKNDAHPLPVTTQGLKAVITGCTGGIGKAIAEELVRCGVELIMVNRTKSKADDFSKYLQNRFSATVHSYIADMSNITETETTARKIAEDFPQIDILINNAGELLNDRKVTAEGMEHNFAVLLLAPFTITQTLLPSLKNANPLAKNRPARVINMCSGGLYTQGLHMDDLQYEQGEFNGAKAYARAKRGLLDITEQYARTQDKYSVVFHAMHPGWVHTYGVEKSLATFLKVTRPVLRTPFQGADTALWLALNQAPNTTSGLFWLDRRPHITSIFPGTKTHPSQQSELFVLLNILLTHCLESRKNPGVEPIQRSKQA